MDFGNTLQLVLKRYRPELNMDSLREHQRGVLQHLWDDMGDVLLCVPTGYGKSLIYQLAAPLLRMRNDRENGSVVVISPLNMIHLDQLIVMRDYGLTCCKLDIEGYAKVYGSDAGFVGESQTGNAMNTEYEDDSSHNDQICLADADISDIMNGRFDVIMAHPEALLCTRFGRELRNSALFINNVLALFVDECHTADQWAAEFRTAFGKLNVLPSVFNCSVVGLSASVTVTARDKLPKTLGMVNPKLIVTSPDKANIFLRRIQKPSNTDIHGCAMSIYEPECHSLLEKRDSYPVTLLYMPISWMTEAMGYAHALFAKPELSNARFSCLFSTQDGDIRSHIVSELKKNEPHLRLLFCTACVGMGFDSPSISRVIHAKPPRSIVDYIQQIGRAGRAQQKSEAILYFNKSDIACNVPGITNAIIDFCTTENCLRLTMLKYFGFESKCDDMLPCECCSNCEIKCTCETCRLCHRKK